MHVGYLTALASIRLDELYHFHHTVHVTAAFEETEYFVESELAKNVKGIVLEPGLFAVSAYNRTLKSRKDIFTPRSNDRPFVANSSRRIMNSVEQESTASSISSNELIL